MTYFVFDNPNRDEPLHYMFNPVGIIEKFDAQPWGSTMATHIQALRACTKGFNLGI